MNEKIDALAFGAHPDDVELMCGGTMIKLAKMGYQVGIISLTAGELGSKGTAEIRNTEFNAASEIMGLKIHKILDIPDGGVAVKDEYKIKVIEQIRQYTPKIIFAPYWKTRHPDHGYCSQLVRESAFLSGLKKIETGQAAFRPARVIYYMERFEFLPSFIVDISDVFERKMEAIKSYKSQIYNPDDSPNQKEMTYISSYSFLQSIVFRGQYWGHKIGNRYGEPFYVNEPLNIDDPVQHFQHYAMAGLL
jgi:bacillithiol biosynthesis deacetylase BshB1